MSRPASLFAGLSDDDDGDDPFAALETEKYRGKKSSRLFSDDEDSSEDEDASTDAPTGNNNPANAETAKKQKQRKTAEPAAGDSSEDEGDDGLFSTTKTKSKKSSTKTAADDLFAGLEEDVHKVPAPKTTKETHSAAPQSASPHAAPQSPQPQPHPPLSTTATTPPTSPLGEPATTAEDEDDDDAESARPVVTLDRSNGKKMGIRLGNAKSHCGVPIVWVDEAGQAAGMLEVGDVVVEINGTSVRGKSSKDAGTYVKQSELVKLSMGDKNETPADARRKAKEKAAAKKQKNKDEKVAEKKRIEDEKAKLKQRIADEKLAKKREAAEAKQKIIDENAAEEKRKSEEKERLEDEKAAEKARVSEEKASLKKRVEEQKKAEELAAAAAVAAGVDEAAAAGDGNIANSDESGSGEGSGTSSNERSTASGVSQDHTNEESSSNIAAVPSNTIANVDDGSDPLSNVGNNAGADGMDAAVAPSRAGALSATSSSATQPPPPGPPLRGGPGSVVILDRQEGKKMGIRLGDARPSCGVPIVWVAEGGQAVGKLEIGDVVVAINGINVRSKSSREAGTYIKQTEIVQLTLGDPTEDPVAAKKAEKQAAAAERQRIKDGKAAEKKRISDEKAALKQRIADEKAAKKQAAADAKVTAKKKAAEDKATEKAVRKVKSAAAPDVVGEDVLAAGGAKHGLGALVDSGAAEFEEEQNAIKAPAKTSPPPPPPPNMPLCPKMRCGAQMPKIYYMGGIYSQGWFCDECGASSHKLPNGAPRHSCERCRMDFCEACASSYSTAAMEAAAKAASAMSMWSCEYCDYKDSDYDAVVAHEAFCDKGPNKEGTDDNSMVWRCEHCEMFGHDFDKISEHEKACLQEQERKKTLVANAKAAKEAAPLLDENDVLPTAEPAALQTSLPAAPADILGQHGASVGGGADGRSSGSNCSSSTTQAAAGPDVETQMEKVLATASSLMERARRVDVSGVTIAEAKDAAAAAANAPRPPPSKPEDSTDDIAAGISLQTDALRTRAASLLKMLAAASAT